VSTFTAALALDALKVQLDARGNLSGVEIATGGLGSDTPKEAITFDRVEQGEDHVGMAIVEELYEINGSCYIEKPGKGEAIIKSARDRALALVKELKDQLDDDETINSTVMTSRFSRFVMNQDVTDPPGRVCNIEFVIEGRAVDA